MGYLEDLIKAKLVQLGDTTLKTVAPIVRHARMRAKVTKEAEEGTNRLWQLRTLPKVIQQDNRTTTQKAKDRKEADERHLQYQQQLNELKATEGFNNLLKLTSPSTYVEAATGLQLTPAGKLATDILTFGMAGGVKSLLTRGGSKAISSPSIIRTSSTQRTLGLVKGISGEIPTTPAEWTAAQDAAIARGDMAEAQRLNELHASINNYHFGFYHETSQPFISFNKPGKNSYDDLMSPFGVFTKNTDKAIGLGGYQMPLIVRYKNPLQVESKKELFGLLPEDLQNEIQILFKYRNNNTNQALWDRAYMVKQRIGKFLQDNGYDALKIDKDWAGTGLVENERWTDATIVPSPGNVKSPDAVTYDPVTGERIPLGDRHDFSKNNILWFSTHPITRASKIHLTRNSPLQTRLARLREHTRYGFTPETNLGLMITPRIRSHYVKAFAKQIDPNLTEELLNLIAQIAYANGRGMHIPIGNNVGETVGGLSIVDIQNAIKYLKLSGIKDVTPNDIGIIAGHEAGHGVQISPAAKRAVEGFSEPDEFYTRAGQVLDAAGIKSTANKRILFNQFMNMIDDYLSKGNLDNGVSEIRDFLRSKTEAVDRQNIMKHINELSGFSGAAYLGSKYYEKKIH